MTKVKAIIKTETYDKKRFFSWIGGISFALFAILMIFPSLFGEISDIATNSQIYKDIVEKYEKGVNLLPEEENILENYNSAAGYAWSYVADSLTEDVARAILVGLAVFAVGTIAWVVISKMTLTVTKEFLYGTTLFGKRIELPLDSVTAIGTNHYKGLFVSTPSYKISYLLVSNRDKVLKCINKLVAERNKPNQIDIAVEIIKLKALLDDGAISKKAYDKIIKQLINLKQ